MAIVYGLTLGTAKAANSAWLNTESFVESSSWGGADFPTYRHAAVLLGGFILGHADNVSSVALQRIPEGVAYLVYGGTGTVLSQLLNYAQQGSRKPSMLLGGMLLVVGGILSTSLSQFLRPSKRAVHPESESTAVEMDLQHPAEGSLVSVEKETCASPAQGKKTTRDAIVLALICGLLCGCWSPLSTFAMNSQLAQVPFVVLLIFPLGQLLALPSVVSITLCLENRTREQKGLPKLSLADVFREIRDLGRTKKAWGVICGLGINSGYCFYFTATAAVPSAVVFGITCCASIVPLLREVLVTDSFTGATNRVRVFLLLSFIFYAAAIGVLASIA